MIAKLLVLLGILIVFLSNSYALWKFFSASGALKNSAAEGVGGFVDAFDAAFYGLMLSFIGIFLLFLGCALLFVPKKSKV